MSCSERDDLDYLLKYLNRLNRVKDVEKCVLHLDARRLDIDGIVRLCAENKLFDALTYVFNNGIMEYAEPIKYIIRELKEATDKHIAEQSDTSFEKMTAEYFRKKLFSYFSKIMGQVNGTAKTGDDRSPHRPFEGFSFGAHNPRVPDCACQDMKTSLHFRGISRSIRCCTRRELDHP